MNFETNWICEDTIINFLIQWKNVTDRDRMAGWQATARKKRKTVITLLPVWRRHPSLSTRCTCTIKLKKPQKDPCWSFVTFWGIAGFLERVSRLRSLVQCACNSSSLRVNRRLYFLTWFSKFKDFSALKILSARFLVKSFNKINFENCLTQMCKTRKVPFLVVVSK